jgi:CRP-like cAMP-binding protein
MVFKRAPGRLAMFQETVTQLLDEFKAQSLANLARRRKVITAATRLQEITNG